MVANEDVHTYHRKIVDTEFQIAGRLLKIPHENEDDKRAVLQREIEDLRFMLTVYHAAKAFLEKVYLKDSEVPTSTNGPPHMQA